MLPVLMLFLIPVGGGIPAGVLLAKERALPWFLTAALYFVSDIILAFAFEPVLRLLVELGKLVPLIAKTADIMKASMERTVEHYGGKGAGPFALIMIAFGVDPMTGRAAAMAAGHGFIGGWAIAITGDMIYYGVIAASTLRLSAYFKDPNTVMVIVLVGMIFVPVIVRRVKLAYSKK